MAQVHAALVYFYDHPDEIEADLEADRRWEAEHEQAKAEYFGRRPGT